MIDVMAYSSGCISTTHKDKARMEQCGLALNEEKTKIVYCKYDVRRGSYKEEKFDFLGFTFGLESPRIVGGKHFVNFSPAISKKTITRNGRKIRSWKLHPRSDKTLVDLSNMFNASLQRYINYSLKFYKSVMYPLFQRLNYRLAH